MTDRTPTSPDGTPIEVRPIQRDDLGKVLIRCLPDGGRIEAMFKTQRIIGMAAWDADKCIAQRLRRGFQGASIATLAMARDKGWTERKGNECSCGTPRKSILHG